MTSLQGQMLINMDFVPQTKELKVGGLFLDKAAQTSG